jgi:hypothetical protein
VKFAMRCSHVHRSGFSGCLAFRRHKINQADTSFGIREGGLEDEGALAISPVSDFGRRPRSYLPSAVLWLTEQRRKTAIGIEAPQTQPVDRSISRNEGRGFAITDHSVVRDTIAKDFALYRKMNLPVTLRHAVSWR